MRRLVVAAIVALLTLTLFGCGGGEEAAPAEDANANAAPAAAVSKSDNPEPIADRSSDSTDAPIPIGDMESLPEEIKENLANDSAMILFFYNGDQKVTDDTRKQVEKAADDNAGMVNLIEYNLGKASSTDENGVISVDASVIEDDPSLAAAIALARDLKVTGTPYTVVIDDQGFRIFAIKGYIDRDLLGRQIERAAQ